MDRQKATTITNCWKMRTFIKRTMFSCPFNSCKAEQRFAKDQELSPDITTPHITKHHQTSSHAACRKMISRNVRCASVEFWKASKHLFRAKVLTVLILQAGMCWSPKNRTDVTLHTSAKSLFFRGVAVLKGFCVCARARISPSLSLPVCLSLV